MSLLAHLVSGDGPPVLLLNGGLMSMAAWDEVAGPLEAHYRVLRCDFRGQLLSPGDPPVALDGHVQDLLHLLDALRMERVHVVGTSFGAAVGLLLAARHPERAASLVAITAPARVTPEMREGALGIAAACRTAAAGGDGGAVIDALLPGTYSPAWQERNRELLAERRRMVALLPREWFLSLARLVESVSELDLGPALASVRCPTLIVAAELDRTFPPEHSRALAQAIPGASLEVVSGAGHALVIERPQELLPILSRFLARVTRTEASP